MKQSNTTSHQIRSLLYAAICVLFWALIPVCSKRALTGVNSYLFLSISSLISAVTMLIYLVSRKRLTALKRLSAKDIVRISFLGLLGSFVYYLFLYKAFALSSAQEVFVINYLWPVLVVLFASVILGERLKGSSILSILISFCGVVLIATRGNPLALKLANITGDVLAFFAAVSFALFSVLGKGSKYDNDISVFIYFAVSFLFSLLLLPAFTLKHLTPDVIFWLLVNGIFANGISYIFWFEALKGTQTAIVSNMVYLTPFVALLFIRLFLGETIHTYSLEALMLIVIGILMQGFLTKRSQAI